MPDQWDLEALIARVPEGWTLVCFRSLALLSLVRSLGVSRRLKFVFLPPLFDQFAQRDREVARGALKALGATLKLFDAARVRARGDGRQRVIGLRIQAFRRRLHLLLRARERLRGGS